MRESDKRHFWEMLQGLAASTKSAITTGVLKVYWMTLQDLTLQEFNRAIARAVEECEFFPSVAELRTFAGKQKWKPQPHYLQPAEDELERIETCQFHHKTPKVAAPDPVAWCRKCKRLRLAAEGKGKPQALGELMEVAGLLPPGDERR